MRQYQVVYDAPMHLLGDAPNCFSKAWESGKPKFAEIADSLPATFEMLRVVTPDIHQCRR